MKSILNHQINKDHLLRPHCQQLLTKFNLFQTMDADSSYGGSDTAQDFNSSHFDTSHVDNSHHVDTNHHNTQNQIHSDANHHTKVQVSHDEHPSDKVITSLQETNDDQVNHQFYHKNEITLPVNYDEDDKDEIDFQKDSVGTKEPHYMSTAKINVNDCPDAHSNLEEMSKNFRSTSNLNVDSPECDGKYEGGIENPAFVNDTSTIKSTFNKEKPYNGDLNASLGESENSF